MSKASEVRGYYIEAHKKHQDLMAEKVMLESAIDINVAIMNGLIGSLSTLDLMVMQSEDEDN